MVLYFIFIFHATIYRLQISKRPLLKLICEYYMYNLPYSLNFWLWLRTNLIVWRAVLMHRISIGIWILSVNCGSCLCTVENAIELKWASNDGRSWLIVNRRRDVNDNGEFLQWLLLAAAAEPLTLTTSPHFYLCSPKAIISFPLYIFPIFFPLPQNF